MKKSTITVLILAALSANVSANGDVNDVLREQRVDIDANTAAIQLNESAQNVVNNDVDYRLGGLENRADLVDGDINYLKDSQARQEGLISDQASRVDALGNAVEGTLARVDEATNLAVDANNKVDGVKDQVNLNSGAIDSLKDQVAATDANVNLVDNKVNDLSEQVNATTDSIKDQVNTIDRDLGLFMDTQNINTAEVNDKLAKHDTAIEGLGEDLLVTNDRIDNLGNTVGEIDTKLTGVGALAQENADDISKLAVNQAATNQAVQNNTTDLTTVKDNVEVMGNDLAAVSGKVENNTTAINGLTDRADKTDVAISNVNNKVDNNTTAIVGLGETTTALKTEQVAQSNRLDKETTDRIAGDKAVLSQSMSYTNKVAGDTLSSANGYTNKKFAQLKGMVDQNKRRADAGISGALAASQIPQVGSGKDFSVGAGAGSYGSQAAVAVGFSARLNENTVTKVAVTADSQHAFGVGAGVSYEW